MKSVILFLLLGLPVLAEDSSFEKHGKLRVAKSGTHLEHADGTPFFLLADTCWAGPALAVDDNWQAYLSVRKEQGFTAIQFNMACPWRVAPTDLFEQASYTIQDGKLVFNEAYYKYLDAQIASIVKWGLLPMPVLAWAHKKGDAGFDLTEAQIIELIDYQLERYKDLHALWILAGDARYNKDDAEKWKRIGRAVFAKHPQSLVTTHPTGMNFPWKDWADEKWLTVLGYQSGHGDDAKTWKWLTSGPATEFWRSTKKPIINLEPPYEDHNGYQSKKPHTAESVRRAIYWSLLVHPCCGVTYGAHGVWSWQNHFQHKAGEEPPDHKGSGVAKSWNVAMRLPGAEQMIHLRTIFDGLDWPSLRPAPELVAEQPGKDDPGLFVAAAQNESKSLKVLYLPKGAKFVGRNLGTADRKWIDPATGEVISRGLLPPAHDGDLLFVIGK